jgi:uncharacterized protein
MATVRNIDQKGQTMRSILIFVVGLGLMQAQEVTSAVEPPSVRVHGEATISVEPDQAQFDIGVVTQAATAKAATNQNAAQANALVQELRTLLPSSDIKTVNFSVNPDYRYPKEGGPATITGYTANDTVRLLLNDISMIQKVIDTATKSGANSVNRLTFMLKDEKAARARALGDAASQAESGAEALAGSLHLKLGRLLHVEEGQPVIISPPREVSFGKAQSTDITPISPGTIDVHADVNLTYEIARGR